MSLRFLIWVFAPLLWLSPEAHSQQGDGNRAATYQLDPEPDWEAEADALLERLRQRPERASGEWAQRLRTLALVLPEPLAETVRNGDGTGAAAWWARRDPRPSTLVNEALAEHVEREAIARALFRADTPTGLDARGSVFVRFGAPPRSRVIDVADDLFISRAIRDDPAVRLSDFPRNEAWYYPRLGAYFLFVQRRGVYREGRPIDLIPRSLRTGGLNRATVSRARLLGQSIRWVYKDLFEFSPEVRRRLTLLDSQIGGDGAAFSGNTGFILSDEIQRARREDEDAALRRDDALPSRVSSRPDDVRSGVRWRLARFLSAEGTPEVAIAWRPGLAPDAVPEASGAVFDIVAVRYAPGYARAGLEQVRVVDRDADRGEAAYDLLIPAPETDALAVEWSRRVLIGTDQMLTDPVDIDVAWADSLGSLVASDAQIGVSDLLLLDPTRGAEVSARADALPLALTEEAVVPGEPLGFYFETYRQMPTDTPLTTEIEVFVSERTAGGLFRRAQATGSSIAFTDRMDGPLASRVVDLGRAPEADELQIEVVVTVAETGERASRTLRIPVRR